MTKQCHRCKEAKDTQEFNNNKNQEDGKNRYCRTCERAYANQRANQLRDECGVTQGIISFRKLRYKVMTKYCHGEPTCQCCGEMRIRFLAFDHVDGGGNLHRKEVHPVELARWLRDNNYPSGFQVLCHNCNAAKSAYGECPHKREQAGLPPEPYIPTPVNLKAQKADATRAKVLAGATSLVLRGIYPSPGAIKHETGVSTNTAWQYGKVLRSEGQWPNADGLMRAKKAA